MGSVEDQKWTYPEFSVELKFSAEGFRNILSELGDSVSVGGTA